MDITLDLSNGKFTPFRKPNNQPQYVNSHSNHPPSIIKQIPKSINKRLSSLSSDQQSFDECKAVYENALKQSDYIFPLHYSNHDSTNPPSTNKRKRQRNIIWYNPPPANPSNQTSQEISSSLSISIFLKPTRCTKYSIETP